MTCTVNLQPTQKFKAETELKFLSLQCKNPFLASLHVLLTTFLNMNLTNTSIYL